MTTTDLRASYATWVQEDQPTRNYFRKTGYMRLYGKTGRRNEGIVWFTNPFPATGANVASAKLVLKTRPLSGTGTTNITVHMAGNWSNHFGTVNWRTRPSTYDNVVQQTRKGPLGADAAWTLDVTEMMQRVASGATFGGFVLSTTNTKVVDVQGNMSAIQDPHLIVDWTEAPLPPDDLAPSTGLAIGTDSPLLSWDFYDVGGDTDLRKIQVQTAASETGFATPSWDSGEVESTVTELDLSKRDDWVPPAPDVTVWWRVRNQDGAGLWSEWADPVPWQYHERPSVTLVQPEPDPSDGSTASFSDPTPVIQWAYKGDLPQARWRIGVYQLHDSTWQLIAASDFHVNTESDWTPDVGLADAGQVRIVVDVFDGRDREAVPGYPIYGSVGAVFEFKPGDDLEVPKNLKVTPLRPTPEVRISWDRSEVPDRWDIYRDDVLLSRHDGLDWLIDGDHYEMIDRFAPNGAHRWKLFAIVNGVAARSQQIEIDVARGKATWLEEPDDYRRVAIIDDTDHDMELAETVAEHEILGARSKVVITSAQRGYEGTLEGKIADWDSGMPDGDNAQVWHDNLMDFKSMVGHTFRMAIEDIVIPVKIYQVNVRRDKVLQFNGWYVNLHWHQVGDFGFKGVQS